MSARRVHSALVVVGILVLLASALSAQDSRVRIVRLSYIDGQVQIDRNAGQGMEKAILNMPIVEGSRLSAEQGSHVEVEFENGSTMRLVGPAQVSFPELTLRPNGDKNTLIAIQNGLVYFAVQKVKNDEFRIAFENHTVAVHKSAEFRVDVSAPEQKLAVFKGELNLLGGEKSVAVKKNESLTFQGNQSEYALAKGVDEIGADVWNHDRDSDRQLVARSEEYHATNSYYGGNYNYGLYELSRYGNWYYGPGYGWLWRPYYFDPAFATNPYAWDPFGNGAWSYYAGSGWVFVSSYPWGWAPYRYGSWMFVPGYGWSWQPGPATSGWRPVPLVVDPPKGYSLPSPPVRGPGETVVSRAPNGVTTAPVTGFRTPTRDSELDAAKRRTLPTGMVPLTRKGPAPINRPGVPATSAISGTSRVGPAGPANRQTGAPHASPRSAPVRTSEPRMSAPPPMHTSSGGSSKTPH